MRFSRHFWILLAVGLSCFSTHIRAENDEPERAKRWRQFGFPICQAALDLTVQNSGSNEEQRRKNTLDAISELRHFRQSVLGFDNSVDASIEIVRAASNNQKNRRFMKSLASRIRGLEINLGDTAGGQDDTGAQASFGIRVVGTKNVLEAIHYLNNDPLTPWPYFNAVTVPYAVSQILNPAKITIGLLTSTAFFFDNPDVHYLPIGYATIWAFSSLRRIFSLLRHSLIPDFALFRDLSYEHVDNHRLDKENSKWLYFSDNLMVPVRDPEGGGPWRFIWMAVDIFLHFREANEDESVEFQAKHVPELLIFTRGATDDPTKNYPRKRKNDEKEALTELKPAWVPIPAIK